MPVLSIRVSESTANEIELKASILHISKSAYINQAITNLNQQISKELLREQINKASKKVRKNSMSVNLEFSNIDDKL
jgi:predicted transcriptional regulator